MTPPKQGSPQSCVACKSKRTYLRTGPDGYNTLCGPCYTRYIALQLPLFKRPSGHVTARRHLPNTTPVAATAFATLPRNDSIQDLRHPLVSPCSRKHHAALRRAPAGVPLSERRTVRRQLRQAASLDSKPASHRTRPSVRAHLAVDASSKITDAEVDDPASRAPHRADALTVAPQNTPAHQVAHPPPSLTTWQSAPRHATAIARPLPVKNFPAKLRCSYGWASRTRSLFIAYNIGLSSLLGLAADTFELRVPFVLAYRDADGDIVGIESETDMPALFAAAREGPQPLRLALLPPHAA